MEQGLGSRKLGSASFDGRERQLSSQFRESVNAVLRHANDYLYGMSSGQGLSFSRKVAKYGVNNDG